MNNNCSKIELKEKGETGFFLNPTTLSHFGFSKLLHLKINPSLQILF